MAGDALELGDDALVAEGRPTHERLTLSPESTARTKLGPAGVGADAGMYLEGKLPGFAAVYEALEKAQSTAARRQNSPARPGRLGSRGAKRPDRSLAVHGRVMMVADPKAQRLAAPINDLAQAEMAIANIVEDYGTDAGNAFSRTDARPQSPPA